MSHLDEIAEKRRRKAYKNFEGSKYEGLNPFKVGDLVMLRRNNDDRDPLRKLRPRFTGPYTVAQIDGLMLALAARAGMSQTALLV